MGLGARMTLNVAVIAFLALGAVVVTFLAAAFLALVALGVVLGLLFYVRVRLLARRLRKAMAQTAQAQPSPSASTPGPVMDADFKVDK